MFVPDYRNVLSAAKNIQPKRVPVYEHIISIEVMEKVLNENFADLINGDYEDKKQHFRKICKFFHQTGYDTISFEHIITSIMPGAGALYFHKDPVIKTEEDYRKYPWDEIPDIFYNKYNENFYALAEVMPAGMKLIGGPGNGIFEIVQDLCGYENLCYFSIDNPDVYAGIFASAADVMKKIWVRFLEEHGEMSCIGRFGDDLGFSKQTLISPTDIRKHLVPRYKELIEIIHSYGKPFILHSCGSIFDVMEDFIEAGIDTKHSNEDKIAPFKEWVDRYGDRIGNFGGVDCDILCECDEYSIIEYVTDIYHSCVGHGGIAIGSGNSIPDYIPVESYLTMINTVRKLRGEENIG